MEREQRGEEKKKEAFGLCLVFDASSPRYCLQMWGASVRPLPPPLLQRLCSDTKMEGRMRRRRRKNELLLVLLLFSSVLLALLNFHRHTFGSWKWEKNILCFRHKLHMWASQSSVMNPYSATSSLAVRLVLILGAETRCLHIKHLNLQRQLTSLERD